jgi:hypothetical protein
VKAAGPAGVLLLLTGVSGCGGGAPTRPVALVREAVLKQQVAYWLDDHARESGVVICIAVADGEHRVGLDGSFLEQSRDRLAVRPAEQCEARPSGAIERATSGPAIILTVGTVTWVGDSEAVVEVQHFRSAAVSGQRKYRVVREEAGWVCLGQVVDMAPG